MPDAKAIFLLWTTISLAVIAAFLVVLYCIWKIDFFQDYRRMSWKTPTDDRQTIYKHQSDIDISMFPSPHQIVPTLFPNDMTSAAANGTGLPYGKFIPFVEAGN